MSNENDDVEFCNIRSPYNHAEEFKIRRAERAKRRAIQAAKTATTEDLHEFLKYINYPNILPEHTNAANLIVMELKVRDLYTHSTRF